MKVNIILFDRGSGGNFLARVLTLDPSTVALGNLNNSSPEQRCDYYCYKLPTGPLNTLLPNGLSTWVDAELNQFYFPFTRGIEQLLNLNQTVIEPMHPDHYANKLQLLGPDDQVNVYYIDPSNCEQWIAAQVRHKIDARRVQPLPVQPGLAEVINRLDAHPISLEQMIKSELTFVDEYVKICNSMNLISYADLALRIYKTWRTTWG